MDQTLAKAALAGGLFALLTFVHFVIDWIFQSHAEAMVKHNNPRVRAKHCAIYTAPFVVVLYLLGMSWANLIVSAFVLFFSHFVEDTYVPVYLWAKHIRQPPGMTPIYWMGWDERPEAEYRKAFVEFIETPLGKILMIVVDQIIHLAFLWVPVLLLVC